VAAGRAVLVGPGGPGVPGVLPVAAGLAVLAAPLRSTTSLRKFRAA